MALYYSSNYMRVGIGCCLKHHRAYKYVITLVDYFSKWPEAEPLLDKSAKGVALFLYKDDVHIMISLTRLRPLLV